VRPEYTLKADRFAPINVYRLYTRLVLSHEGHRDTIEIEPVAEADLLDYLLSRQADRVKATPPPDCVAANLLAIALGKLTTEQLCEAVAQAKREAKGEAK
jgi:hypothetical protein